MSRQEGKYKDAKLNLILLVNIHLIVIVMAGILFYVLSGEKAGFFGWFGISTSVSLLILVSTYKLYPHWYRNKNNTIED